jgi:hypothetical protein
VVLAGLGRNGTEAAAQFATSPAQALADRIGGGGFGNRNIEAAEIASDRWEDRSAVDTCCV